MKKIVMILLVLALFGTAVACDGGKTPATKMCIRDRYLHLGQNTVRR